MINRLEPCEKLLAGTVLIVVALIGLAYRLTGYGMVITGSYIFYGVGFTQRPMVISVVFITIAILWVYTVYN